MVIGQLELPAGTEHAVGDDSLHFATTDLESSGQRGADRGQGDQIADREVGGTADHLDGIVAAAVVDHDLPYLVGTLDPGDLIHAHDHPVVQPLAHHLDLLDDKAQVVEGGGQVGRVPLEGGKVSQPRKRYAHGC